MSDPLGRTTTYLYEVQDVFCQMIYNIETELRKGPSRTIKQEQYNIALDIILDGAREEMKNYTEAYEEI